MKYRVLISAPYLIPVIERYRPEFESKGVEIVVASVKERLEEDDLLKIIGEIDGVICGDDRFTPRVLEAAKRLKVISKWGTGIDSIDKLACASKSVAIRNTPNAFSEPVADTVLAYCLNYCRNIMRMTLAMRQGEWKKIQGYALNEATIGIIGIGNIGTAVARRAAAFGGKVLGYDIQSISSAVIQQTGLEVVDLKTLLHQSDIVTLHTDLNPTSHHLINANTLALFKKTALLINTSRGPVIDEEALVEALKRKAIGGVALDVFEDEPLPLSSKLRSFENVALAPHNSNSSPLAWERVHLNTIKNLFEVLEQSTMRAG